MTEQTYVDFEESDENLTPEQRFALEFHDRFKGPLKQFLNGSNKPAYILQQILKYHEQHNEFPTEAQLFHYITYRKSRRPKLHSSDHYPDDEGQLKEGGIGLHKRKTPHSEWVKRANALLEQMIKRGEIDPWFNEQ